MSRGVRKWNRRDVREVQSTPRLSTHSIPVEGWMGGSGGIVCRSVVWIVVYGLRSFTSFNSALRRRIRLQSQCWGGLAFDHDTSP